MANENKKYVEVINNGTENLYVYDGEARAMIKPVASVAEVTAALAELT